MNRAPAPIGAEVGLYVDLVEAVEIGHVIETRAGRRYAVTAVRVQERGKHAGRQHLRCVVLAEGHHARSQRGDFRKGERVEPAGGVRVHRIRWYHRRRNGGVKPKGRR